MTGGWLSNKSSDVEGSQLVSSFHCRHGRCSHFQQQLCVFGSRNKIITLLATGNWTENRTTYRSANHSPSNDNDTSTLGGWFMPHSCPSSPRFTWSLSPFRRRGPRPLRFATAVWAFSRKSHMGAPMGVPTCLDQSFPLWVLSILIPPKRWYVSNRYLSSRMNSTENGGACWNPFTRAPILRFAPIRWDKTDPSYPFYTTSRTAPVNLYLQRPSCSVLPNPWHAHPYPIMNLMTVYDAGSSMDMVESDMGGGVGYDGERQWDGARSVLLPPSLHYPQTSPIAAAPYIPALVDMKKLE